MKFFRKKVKKNIVNVRNVAIDKPYNRKRTEWFFKIAILGLVIFLILRGVDYTKPSNFPINSVKIFATYEHIDKEILQKTIAPYLLNGFFYLNVIWMKQRLLQHPWVYSVSIQREWPDTVRVTINEQKATLKWGMKALVNFEGQVFAPPIATFPQGLPMIFGPDGSERKIFSLYQKVSELYKPLDLTIKQLVLNLQKYWEVVFSNNMTVYLKEDDPFGQLELLAKIYRKLMIKHEAPPKTIDLRYRSGFAVKW